MRLLLRVEVGAGVIAAGSEEGQNPLHFQLCAFAVVSTRISVQSSEFAHWRVQSPEPQ